MSSQIRELKKLLSTPTPTRGTLVGWNGSSAVVATTTGSVTLSVLTSTKLAIGDMVAIRDGAVVGRLKGESAIPHFVV